VAEIFVQDAFGVVVQTGDFVPSSEKTLGIEVLRHGDPIWWGRRTTGEEQ
jgi:hypothetical protein